MLDDSAILGRENYASVDRLLLAEYLDDYLDENDIHRVPCAEAHADFVKKYGLNVNIKLFGYEVKKRGFKAQVRRIGARQCKAYYRKPIENTI